MRAGSTRFATRYFRTKSARCNEIFLFLAGPPFSSAWPSMFTTHRPGSARALRPACRASRSAKARRNFSLKKTRSPTFRRKSWALPGSPPTVACASGAGDLFSAQAASRSYPWTWSSAPGRQHRVGCADSRCRRQRPETARGARHLGDALGSRGLLHLRTRTRRGLRGVKLVLSDAHEGLKAAAAKCSVLPGNAAASTACAMHSHASASVTEPWLPQRLETPLNSPTERRHERNGTS